MKNAMVILCGGNSVRMGTDKALLPFGDACLIEYLVQRFLPYFPKIYLSVKKKGDYAHLNLPVTEIPDIYANAGPMSGIFSTLSMMDEPAAFFMSVDTPFLEPETGLALLNAIGDADICQIEGRAASLETATAAYSKSCIASVGKCLLLHQFTFDALREKCSTKYLSETELAEYAPAPVDIQFYNLDTRANYYHALRMLSGMEDPHTSHALIEYFKDTTDLFLHNIPTFSFVAKAGTLITSYVDRLLPFLERNGIKAIHLVREDRSVIFKNAPAGSTPEALLTALSGANLALTENFGEDAPNQIEILRKGWSETPVCAKNPIAVLADFPYRSESGVPVFDVNKPKAIAAFLEEYAGRF